MLRACPDDSPQKTDPVFGSVFLQTQEKCFGNMSARTDCTGMENHTFRVMEDPLLSVQVP